MRANAGFFTRVCVHWRTLALDCAGASAAEFALVLPLLLLILFGVIQFSIVLNNYIELTNAAAAGARELSISRGASKPFSGTINALDNAAPNLTPATLNSKVVMTVNGTACTSDGAACQKAFAAGDAAVVMATYPCNLNVLWLTFGNCVLTSSATALVQ